MDKKYELDDEFEHLEFDEYEENEDYAKVSLPDMAGDEEKKDAGILKKAAIIVVVLTILFAVGNYGFRLDEVRVIGNKNYTSDEIKNLIGFPENASNTLVCYFKYFRYKVEDIPFLENVDVKIENRNSLCIEVLETYILGCLKEGKKYYYFDKDGVVKEVLSEHQENVPVIEGITAEVLELGESISVENRILYQSALELCELLLDNQIKAQKIEISEEGRFTVYVNDAIRIGIGSPIQLEEKVNEAANILPELDKMRETEDIQGILHMENYDSTKNSIIFTKENSN